MSMSTYDSHNTPTHIIGFGQAGHSKETTTSQKNPAVETSSQRNRKNTCILQLLLLPVLAAVDGTKRTTALVVLQVTDHQ